MLAHIRYEGAASIVASAVVLLALRMVKWEHVKPYLFVYVFTPLFALPRIWQTIIKAGDSEQPLNTTLFGWKHLSENTRDYFGLLLNPLDSRHPHSGLLLALGLVGCLIVARSLWKLAHERERKVAKERFAIFAVVWVGVMVVIYFPYSWGKPLHPASARLFVPFDAFFSLLAAWVVTLLCRRAPLWLPSLVAAAAVFLLRVGGQRSSLHQRADLDPPGGSDLALLRPDSRQEHHGGHRPARAVHGHGLRSPGPISRQAGSGSAFRAVSPSLPGHVRHSGD